MMIMTTYENRPYTLEALARHIVEDGGATFCYVGRGDVRHIDGTDGYVWSVGVRSLSITELSNAKITDRDLVALVLRRHLQQGDLGIALDYGAWIDDGKLYIDAVTRRASRDDAERTGREFGQLAIYNLATGETVTL